MSLENVIKEINLEAGKKANTIIQEGKKEANSIIQKTQEKVDISREKTVKKTGEIVSSMQRTEIASLKLFLKKQKLNAKKEVIDSLFKEAEKNLKKLPEKQKEKILKKLLHKGKEEVNAEYFYCNSADKKTIQKLSKLKFKSNIDCIGGFVLENKEETIRSDQTFDLILEKVREKCISEISLRVFKE